ncbi:MAG TPA: hypothetical protein VFB80_12505 [Pirellulaceae bacterium]|nr:hypothetical protein [Pirellulaceae bacterium]
MTANSAGYSAHVEMFLILNGQQFDLGQIGPEHCIVRNPAEVPPSPGEIVLIVDGNETRLQVYLPHGISSSSRKVAYRPASPAAAPWPAAAASR